jgi:hypothetical protein
MDKKLVWFYGRLLKPYLGYKSKYQRIDIPAKDHQSKLDWQLSLFRLHSGIGCMVDHTGFSKKYGDGLDMDIIVHKSPDIYKKEWSLERGALLNQDFAGMINRRADAAYAQAERENLDTIILSYGGGVDSCTLLAAMLQHPKANRYIKENKLIIRTTSFGKREDPLVWNRLVEMNLPMEFHNYDDLLNDERRWLFVTGDVEPVWGSAFVTLPEKMLNKEDLFAGNWRLLEPWFLEKDPGGLAWEYFRDLQATAPFEIKTCFQAWWWFEWCTNTQCYMFRISGYSHFPTLSPDIIYPGKKVFWFLANTDMFDHGAYVTANRLIPEDMSLLKIHSLKYLADWMGWSEFRPKPKIFSQAVIPKHIGKLRIWNDLTWDNNEDLLDV